MFIFVFKRCFRKCNLTSRKCRSMIWKLGLICYQKFFLFHILDNKNRGNSRETGDGDIDTAEIDLKSVESTEK